MGFGREDAIKPDITIRVLFKDFTGKVYSLDNSAIKTLTHVIDSRSLHR